MLNEMEECGPVECDKYAFLLGSALRNSDQENFFTVYDSILPQNIPKSQLHWIKERARFIAELPEGEFNEWVVDARSFSLAPGKSKMSRSKPTRVTATVSVGALSDDDDETSGPYHSMSSSSRLHKHGSLTDSGRPATVSRKNSLSSEMSEEARGAYDYYPKRSDSVIDSVKIQDVTSPEYDEAIDVESDKSSVESPRSEDSGKGEYNVTQLDEYGIELKTFHRQGYHASDEDSDGNCHPHKKLYGSRSQAQYGYKRPEEDKEEYERATSFDQSSQIFPRFEVDKNRKVTAVDAGTSFPLSRTEPSLSKSYSTGSRTEEWNLKQKRSRAIGRMLDMVYGPSTNKSFSQPHYSDCVLQSKVHVFCPNIIHP
ncbi:hypothetical protein LOTGIDRAFT_238395 [Lottia gigantea]|uniref:Uncharacterized protein n=1 Tax=Lottia gigantea TaxID=225164 RepID=V4B110_LOTGI|nr:hypothetical protein LOTGIDRAFT_238395 [Lottia gigantea]ESP00981.1 hypothetical protein LOTGIDRAFT_238395 [Lottia gigantea]